MAPKPTITAAMRRSIPPPASLAGLVAEGAGELSMPTQPLSPAFQRSATAGPGTAVELPSNTVVSSPISVASLDSLTFPATSPTGSDSANRRSAPTTIGRSLSLGSAIPDTSPVMNETLSVIEEHITDMHTPRSSRLLGNQRTIDGAIDLQNRLSYINGHETDEEESGTYTEAEVLAWTPEQVAQLLEERGADKHQCQVFRDEEITGEVLLDMEQSSLMLNQFDLGKMGRRLALWHKIHQFQLEIRSPKRTSHNSRIHSAAASIGQDMSRTRSASGGTVLPRIPSLMDSPRQHHSRHPSSQHLAGLEPSIMAALESPTHHHSPRPSAASIRSFNQNRRHSSIDYAQAQPGAAQYVRTAPNSATHARQASFDRGWTMGSDFMAEDAAPQSAPLQTPMDDLKIMPSTSSELGMTIVPSLDLDRGYFSGNEVDNRRSKTGMFKKRDSPTHSRAPSDSFGTRRLSSVFRQRRAGSTDSTSLAQSSAAQNYYGSKAGVRTSISAPLNLLNPSSQTSPTVTKLEYGNSHSIDAVAASPNLPESETSSIDTRIMPSSSSQKGSTRSRVTGLRAISDAITHNERSRVQPSSERLSELAKESPLNSPSNAGSSTPSINSKSIDLEESSLIKSTTSSTTSKPAMVPRRKTKKETSAYTRGLEKKSPKLQMVGCDYSGWMKKKSSNIMTTWKPRLFILRGRRLSYYYSEDDTEERGLIDISFHRVLPANNDRIVGLHATVTGAISSPTSPHSAQMPTAAGTDAAKAAEESKLWPRSKSESSGTFIFKLMPPRSGLSKAVNFTKPTVHYFAVDNVQQGRLWMAALMKATIDRDESKEVITTYNQKTISLAKAQASRHRPPALMEMEDDHRSISNSISHSIGQSISNSIRKSISKKSSIDTANNEKIGLNIDFDSGSHSINGNATKDDASEGTNGLVVEPPQMAPPPPPAKDSPIEYLDEKIVAP